jgi:hypothetical protein
MLNTQRLTDRMRPIARRVMTKAWLAVALATAAAIFGSPAVGVASPNGVAAIAVGIDANPGATPANTATSLGTIEACRVVTNGDTFTVDFYVQNIPGPGLEGIQGSLHYTSTKLKVTASSASFMLAAGAGSSVTDLTNPSTDSLPDTDGTFTPIAADFGSGASHSETGSGVLVRVTLQAIANGAASLTLTDVKLADPSFNPIGDTNADGIFDGPVSNAQIRIGQSCSVGGVSEAPDVAGLPQITAHTTEHARPWLPLAAATTLLAVALAAAWRGRRRAA